MFYYQIVIVRSTNILCHNTYYEPSYKLFQWNDNLTIYIFQKFSSHLRLSYIEFALSLGITLLQYL